MLCTVWSQVRFASTTCSSNVAAKISKRCISYEDRGRIRCPIKTEPFHSDLMPLPQKKKVQKSSEESVLDSSVTEYTKNMQLGSAVTRYDDLYYGCAKKTAPRRYAQTWVEGPEPVVEASLLSELDKHIDPAPFEKRSLEERPQTAKPISSSRRFHSWYRNYMKNSSKQNY